MQHIPRKMFTEERRLMEKSGQMGGFAVAAVDKDEIKLAVLEAMEPMKAELLALIKDSMLSMAHSADPEAAAKALESKAITDLQDEKDALEEKVEEVALVKNEIRALSHAIETTKREIATLYRSQGDGNRLDVVTHELDSVVNDTEIATQNIMDIAEQIDDLSERLGAVAEGSQVISDIAEQISSHTMRMFESCNFQDLTGQRITKVVNTLQLIDERLSKIVDIWGPEDIETMEVDADPTGLDGLTKIVNQRSVEVEKVTQDEADEIMSQDDLDALFG